MDDALAFAIHQAYDLEISALEPIHLGYLTQNSKVTAKQGQYFLKGHRPETTNSIDFVINVERFFGERRFPVIQPIQQANGDYYLIYGDRAYVLYPYVQAVRKTQKDLSRKNIHDMAIILAELHQQTQHNIPQHLKITNLEHWNSDKALLGLNRIKLLIQEKDYHDEFDKMAITVIDRKIDYIKQNRIAHDDTDLPANALLHGDYWSGNLFFNKDDNIACMYDFEKTSYAPREREIIRSLFMTCLNGTWADNDFANARIYLKAYHTVYPIDRDSINKAAQAYMVRYFHSTWIEHEHYINKNDRMDDIYSKTYLNTEAFVTSNWIQRITEFID